MRNTKQHGQIIRIGDRWYVRYWERRNVGGNIERKRVTHQLGPAVMRGKRPPADVVNEAERHMATVNSGTIPAERIVTVGDFVGRVYLPWNGRVTDPKTRKGRAPVPVIRQLAERLEIHRLRSGNPQTGPIFANALGKPLALGSAVNRVILPALNRCEVCRKSQSNHQKEDHQYKRDGSIPEWHGWHAARRGLGSNLYRLGVPDMVIQRILRHANVSTTATYYIKTAADDVRTAMAKLENQIAESSRTLSDAYGTQNGQPSRVSSTIQ
jgi:hypothetical protein